MLMAHRSSHPYGEIVRVLVCDDEEAIRDLFRISFEAEGAEVEEAVDGDDCIARAEANCPDLVVLDLFMPNRDGLSALPQLRRLCPRARILIVSAHAAVEIFNRSRARGATACFEKLNFVSQIPQLVARYSAV
jgi:CheY-like chemotaxis protein